VAGGLTLVSLTGLACGGKGVTNGSSSGGDGSISSDGSSSSGRTGTDSGRGGTGGSEQGDVTIDGRGGLALGGGTAPDPPGSRGGPPMRLLGCPTTGAACSPEAHCLHLEQAPDVPTPGRAFFPTLRDLNHDSILDLVTLSTAESFVSVRFGAGDGTFGEATDYPTGPHPAALAIGDVDGDGSSDIVTTNEGSASVTLLVGSSAGRFEEREVPVDAEANRIALGDLNQDGRDDLVSFLTGHSGTVSVSLSDAAGRFLSASPARSVDDPKYFSWLALRDLDADGSLDLAAADTTFYAWPGKGDGTFRSIFVTGNSQPYVFYGAMGDLNGDGYLDAMAGDHGSFLMRILLGQPGPAFDQGGVLDAWIPDDVSFGDWTGDGRTDVLELFSDTIVIAVGAGDGSFTCTFSHGASTSNEFGPAKPSLATGDLNGDGRLDVVVSDAYADTAHVYLNFATLAVRP